MQFPLMPSSAKTIHKCQGDTLKELAVHMGTRKNDHSNCVAFSRVTNMSGLHILEFNETKISVNNDKVTAEMQRLRSVSTMKLCYTPMCNVDQSKFKIAFHNTRSLHHHFEQLQCDGNLRSSDVIGICESRLKTSEADDFYVIQQYAIHRNDQNLKETHYSSEDFESSFFVVRTFNHCQCQLLCIVHQAHQEPCLFTNFMKCVRRSQQQTI